MASVPLPQISLATNAELVRSADPEWNGLFATWLRRQALSDANLRFGPMKRSNDADDLILMSLEDRYGKGWRSNPEARAERDPSWQASLAAEEAMSRDFYEPQTAAAVALALRPAPNLAAALFKIDLIEREELHNYLPMPRDPWEIVAEDMARFEGEVA